MKKKPLLLTAATEPQCDEVHPQCGNCLKHGVECDFDNPELAEVFQAKLLSQVAATPAAGDFSSDCPTSPLLTPTTPHRSSTTPSTQSKATADDGTVCQDHHHHHHHYHQHGVADEPMASPTRSSRHSMPPPPKTPERGSFATPSPLGLRPSTPGLPTTSLHRSPNRLMELRLMHQYTTHTCKTISITSPMTQEAWKVGVPSVAFSGAPYLTDAMLAVAALHLRSLLPDDQELVEASHRYMALSLGGYSRSLSAGITAENAEALFLAASLIAFQSSATRIFVAEQDLGSQILDMTGVKLEPFSGAHGAGGHSSGMSAAYLCGALDNDGSMYLGGSGHGGSCTFGESEPYGLPLSLFHSFQGVKTVTATAWPFLRGSDVVTSIINSQPMLKLNITADPTSFFGGLLDGLDLELAEFDAAGDGSMDAVAATRQAYLHAVAVLNWAHRIPHKGAALVLPATVSRRFVELLEARRPRALVILACFFALLRTLDDVWWLHGVARKEVLGLISLFDRDSPWWPKLAWAVRVALYEGGPLVPPDIWGAEWELDDCNAGGTITAGLDNNFVSHVEILTQMVSALQSLPQYQEQPVSVPVGPVGVTSVAPMDLDFDQQYASLDEIPLD